MRSFYRFVRRIAGNLSGKSAPDSSGTAITGGRPAPLVRRLDGNPIITPDMLPGGDGSNINGPSLIRAPDWLPGRLGRYYLYFAHHRGRNIRLAFADNLEGPWQVHAPGTLDVGTIGPGADHVASPDVHVDESGRRIVLYCHVGFRKRRQQYSYAAYSPDGLAFSFMPKPLGDFYLRMVRWRAGWIGMSKGGVLYRRKDESGPLRRLSNPAFPMRDRLANMPGSVRHVALTCTGDRLEIYFTRIGDAPERVLRAEIDLARPVDQWRAGNVVEVLRPEFPWEGADVPLAPSRSGAARTRENALRDPAIFHEDGRTWLLYSVAGESGIAIAELIQPAADNP